MTSAQQANKMPRSTKIEKLSSDVINTNSSWERNSHCRSINSPQARKNARMTAPPETTETNSDNSGEHAFTATRKDTNPLIAEPESEKLPRIFHKMTATFFFLNNFDGSSNLAENGFETVNHIRFVT